MDDVRPLVSIVIPCYKQAHWLRDAVDSALGQTYPNVEVVVVNDGSPDNTAEVARSYGERVRLIEQPNTGLSASRNAGIQATKAEFIAILDSDDTLHPDCIEVRVGMLLAEPGAGMVTGNVRFVDIELNPTGREGTRRESALGPSFDLITRGNWGATCGTLLTRQALDRCGLYDPLLRSVEDWDEQIRVSRRFRVLYDSEPRADVREVPGSMSRGHVTMWDAAVKVVRKNRAIADSGWRYFWNTRYALFHHLLLMMNRVRFEERGPDRWRLMGRLAAERPGTWVFFVTWGLRFAFNTLLRPLRR